MARWLVTQVDRQFSAADLDELKGLASRGELGRGDMIQPPGASDWLYAVELPELKGLLPTTNDFDDDFDMPRSKVPSAGSALHLIGAAGGYSIYHYSVGIKETNLVLAEIALTEMLVTARASPFGRPPRVVPVGWAAWPKTRRFSFSPSQRLLPNPHRHGHRGLGSGQPGGRRTSSPMPVREDDPLYNPDNYVFVKNAGWMQTPDQRADNRTLFNFLQNKSKFDMENIVLMATIKTQRQGLETTEIAIDKLKRFEAAMVGTLNPMQADPEGEPRRLTETTFQEMLKEDLSLQERWIDSIEVQLGSDTFEQASVDLLEVRAIPKKLD